MFRNFDHVAGFEYFPNSMGMSPFKRTLSCYPVSFMEGKDRTDVEDGGKIILPPSALDELARRNTQYPMLFKLTNKSKGKSTHCGVLEFVAEEGKAFLPYWMMQNLLISEGGQVVVENVSLETATYMKIQPQSVDFLDISNPKAVLEKALRSFACLTLNDVIAISYNDKRYELNVLELKPNHAVSIIECDMNVDFAAPLGYKEPEAEPSKPEPEQDEEIDYCAVQSQDTGFSCPGRRLDGKSVDQQASTSTKNQQPSRRGIPNYKYEPGVIHFKRNGIPKLDSKNVEKMFSAFQGEGNCLKTKK